MTYIIHKAVELEALSAKTRDALDEDTWIISPKYDGCHVIFLFNKGEFLKAVSRDNKPCTSMDHVAKQLRELYDLGNGRVAICGEAWMQGKEFNEISGAFRRHANQPQLQFVPFDIVPFDWLDEAPVLGQLNGRTHTTAYRERLAFLAEPEEFPSSVLPPSYRIIWCGFDTAWGLAQKDAKLLKARTDNFYDGSVLAQAGGLYKVGSGKGGEFIKCKPLISYTVTVTGAALDFGTKTGKNTAALKFTLDGHEQKVSTGLTQSQVDEITAVGWDGYRIEVEAMGKTVNGLLREPRFKGIRIDA